MKQFPRPRSRFLARQTMGLILVGLLLMALSACSLPGSSSPNLAGSSNVGQGVTPVPTSSPRVVGEQPPATGKLPGGVPLPSHEIKPLTFNLVYNDAAMEQGVAGIYTPGSPTYHQYLTSDQIVQRYAESDAQLNVVKSWLTQHGYTILAVDPLRSSISVQASVASIEQSLGIQLQSFTVLGREFFMQTGIPHSAEPWPAWCSRWWDWIISPCRFLSRLLGRYRVPRPDRAIAPNTGRK